MSRTEKATAWVTVLTVAFVVGMGLWLAVESPQKPAAPQPVPQDQAVNQPAANAPAAAHFGYVPQPDATREFLRSLPKPTIREAGPGLFAAGPIRDEKPVLLYRSLYKAWAATHGGEQWTVGAQGIGDCVSWGWAHGCDIHLAVMWELGDTAEFRQAATEAIYGGSRVEAPGVSRGGWGDGSYGGAAAKFVRDWGVVFRQPYPDFGIDLTRYDSRRAKDWGNYGNGGQADDGRFDAEAKKHPVRNVALVRNFDEAARAIESGYPVPVCSGQGFASRRDEQGFARASGGWSHCMCFIGVRYDRRGLLCLNSWGPNWIGGPKWPEDQPEGSFWVDEQTATRMLSGGDSFAVSGYEGFPYRSLKHGDWATVETPQAIVLARDSKADTDAGYALAP